MSFAADASRSVGVASGASLRLRSDARSSDAWDMTLLLVVNGEDGSMTTCRSPRWRHGEGRGSSIARCRRLRNGLGPPTLERINTRREEPMLGLTSLGVVHTAISLVALVAAIVALVRDKEIRRGRAAQPAVRCGIGERRTG